MIRINNIKYPLLLGEENLPKYIADRYKLGIKEFKIHRKSIDARKKDDIHYVYSVDLRVENETKALKLIKNSQKITGKKYRFPIGAIPKNPIIIAGFGPAGMMAAYCLAKSGAKVIVLERGNDIDTRINDVEIFRNGGKLDPESNVQFGEGGAGTFSDGKLTTGVNDIRIQYVLDEFANHGAPNEITYISKPHIGTDNLGKMIKAFREDIISYGGQVMFGTRLTDIITENGAVKAVKAISPHGECQIETDTVIAATGHSARDTFKMLKSIGVEMNRKTFAIGARIEHKQDMINQSQYGELHSILPPADYKLSVTTPNGRTAYTFCMCPGGEVVASASEEGGIVTNGMSLYARSGENANSALLVNITPSDLEGDDVLEGCYLQRQIEKKAYDICGGYYAPCRTVGDFLKNNNAPASVRHTYKPGVRFVDFDSIFPCFVVETMRQAIPLMAKKLSGFDDDGAIITAPETRSSSPVQIVRDNNTRESNIRGLYPCGEGAGYAGGIMTAAVDGIKTAEAIILKS